ncbi:MAG: cadherin-like beta sandwich domain-containing protein, partial [Gammaproteobacteria bacterium]|nr:cadherin-like beta sandwich domain-containing protein [Gammaproteobacteria bacterium]
GALRNLGLTNVRIEGGVAVASLAFHNAGVVLGSFAEGEIKFAASGSGLVVGNSGEILNSSFGGFIVPTDDDFNAASGLVQVNTGIILNSSADAYISAKQRGNCAALSNTNEIGSIANSYAQSKISCAGGSAIGGLAGSVASSEIKNSYAAGDLTVTGSGLITDNLGALVGILSVSVGRESIGRITDSYTIADIAVDSATNYTRRGRLAASLEGRSIIDASYFSANTAMTVPIVGHRDGASTIQNSGIKTQSQLLAGREQTSDPNMAYYDWSDDDWDFGSSEQYPMVRYAEGDGTAACRDFAETAADLPICHSRIGGQYAGLDNLELADANAVLTPDFYGGRLHYDLRYNGALEDGGIGIPLFLVPTARDSTAIIKIHRSGGTTAEVTAMNNKLIELEAVMDGDLIEIDVATDVVRRYSININFKGCTDTLGLEDSDGDNLLEIAYLDDLDKLRDLDCIGYELTRDLDFYDNAHYRDLNNKTRWIINDYADASDTGWHPIEQFGGILDGNGYTIRNLQINRDAEDDVGLFAELLPTATVRYVNVSAARIEAKETVGIIAGKNIGTILGSSAAGQISAVGRIGGLVGVNGNAATSDASGISGRILNSFADSKIVRRPQRRCLLPEACNPIGGLVGVNHGRISNSYALGSIDGNGTSASHNAAGGLVGIHSDSLINNSYASVVISGSHAAGGLIGVAQTLHRDGVQVSASFAASNIVSVSLSGGIIGMADNSSDADMIVIADSYSISRFIQAESDDTIGNLLALPFRLDISVLNSYWDSAINNTVVDASANNNLDLTLVNSAGKSSAELRNNDEDYYGWHGDDWDFVTGQYPALKYAKVSASRISGREVFDDTAACRSIDEAVSRLPLCGTTIAGSRRVAANEQTASLQLELIGDDFTLAPSFDAEVSDYRVTVLNDTPSLRLKPTVGGATAFAYLDNGIGLSRRIASGAEIEVPLKVGGDTDIVIDLRLTNAPENYLSRYRIGVQRLHFAIAGEAQKVDADGNGLIEIRTLDDLNVMRYQLDGSGYRISATATKIIRGCPSDGCRGYELTRDLDFGDDASYRDVANKAIWTSGRGWQPLGDADNPFIAIFKAKTKSSVRVSGVELLAPIVYTISGLLINRPSEDRIGLFGETAYSAVIEGIALRNVAIRGNDDVGGLVGVNRGIINNSHVAVGTISGEQHVGGLVG